MASPSIKDVNHQYGAYDKYMRTNVALVKEDNYMVNKDGKYGALENIDGTKSVQPSTSYKTVALDDDKRTEEVLKDLGLHLDGSNGNNIILKAYKEWIELSVRG